MFKFSTMADKGELKAVTQITPEVKQFQFRLEEENWDFKPGQHTVMQLEDEEGEVERPYTMINLPGNSETFALAIKKYPDGRATPQIHEMSVGDSVRFERPEGDLFIRDYSEDVVFISTGTGATPMYAMLRDYLEKGEGKAYYFHGEKTRETLIFKDSLELLETENPNMETVFSVTDESWKGLEGYIQDHLTGKLDSFEGKHFYICGVPEMVVQTQKLLEEKGVNPDKITTEGWEKDAV